MTGAGTGARREGVSADERLAELGALVDQWIGQELAGGIRPPAERFAAMLAYHLGWRDAELNELPSRGPTGKKLRPGMLLLVCEAAGGRLEDAHAAAVAVELVHNFSLVHDDIQDRSELRHHRPTLWRLWGPEQGINAGDALFALAQLALAREETERAARMSATLGEACLRLVEGQYLDLELQRGALPLTLEAYEAMIARKTGALFECACRLGAMAAGAPESVREAYATFGAQVGIAFQEQDDVLGVWGSAQETGKPEAADVATRKKGLPAALALSQPEAPAWLHQSYAESDGDLHPATVQRVIAHFDALGLRQQCEERVGQHYRDAMDALEAAGGRDPARWQLAAICDRLVSRRS